MPYEIKKGTRKGAADPFKNLIKIFSYTEKQAVMNSRLKMLHREHDFCTGRFPQNGKERAWRSA
jgi:hypothetical protein